MGRRDLLRAIGGGAMLLSAGALIGCGGGNVLGQGDDAAGAGGGPNPPGGRSIGIATNPVPVALDNNEQIFLLTSLLNFSGNNYAVFGTEVNPGLPGRISQVAAWQGSPADPVRFVFDAAGKPVEIYIPSTSHVVTLEWNATNTSAAVRVKLFDGTQLGGFVITEQGSSFAISALPAAPAPTVARARATSRPAGDSRRLPDPYQYGGLVFDSLHSQVTPFSPLLLLLVSALAAPQTVGLLAQSSTVAHSIASHMVLALTFFVALSQARTLVANRDQRPVQATLLPGLTFLPFILFANSGVWLPQSHP